MSVRQDARRLLTPSSRMLPSVMGGPGGLLGFHPSLAAWGSSPGEHRRSATKHAHAVAIAAADEAKAVVFDFIGPLRPGRHRMAERRQARLDETFGAASGELVERQSIVPKRYRQQGLRANRNCNSRTPPLQAVAMKAVLAIALALSADTALAQVLPVPKPGAPGGSCPHGYASSGAFCVPSAHARDAVLKPPGGTCPWGWTSSGSYCLRSGRTQ